MKLNNQTFFFTILLCFALLGKCVDGTPKLLTPLFSSLSSSPTPTPSPSPSASASATSPSPLLSERRKTMMSKTSYPPSQASTQFSDTPYTANSPSDASAPTSDGASSSFSDYLKGKFGDNSKIKYNPGLEQICAKTHHPDVCLATISPLLKNKVDVVHVLQAAIAVTTQNVKMIISKIEKRPPVSSEINASLKECKEHYNKALANLQKAMTATQSKDFGSVNAMLSNVLADVSTAESKVHDLKTPTFNADNFYSLVSLTASNCLSIASLIRN
ncbi:hypothetical protein Lal_00038914 [Lupinus albus]|uniref:Putative peridinin-chlorophyll A binding protein n=1 Tax=Lupinus albus TaxID=3870 RepID=A0A6A5NCZ4_LUPAL|nr:putative peridinin-chlorophyll A binding protein [Lupinus albus]KAF1882268.1 hypothetical protein Lal_00038914 [Lupinus albus]